jgi:hypothetical protein
MAHVDRVQSLESAHKDSKVLEENHTWEDFDASETKTKILRGTWVFRRKRTTGGILSKCKSPLLCPWGYAGRHIRHVRSGCRIQHCPPVSRVSLTLDWYTCSIDFSNAFVQAVVDDYVWIHLPRGFNSSRVGNGKTCLRLCRSLYALSVAPKLWYEHLFAFFINKASNQATKTNVC